MSDEQAPVPATAPAAEAAAPTIATGQSEGANATEKTSGAQPTAQAPVENGRDVEQDMGGVAPAGSESWGKANSEVDDDMNSRKVTLADLCSHAAALFAHKDYAGASDLYAQAAELQAELRGEMDPENAEILFLYGRCLFKVGQSKSNVLGATVSATEGDKAAEDVDDDKAADEPEVKGKKGLVQFEGDEMDEDEQDEQEDQEDQEGQGDGGGGDDEADEEEDELQAAFEALDLAGVLFRKRLEKITEDKPQEKEKRAEPDTTKESEAEAGAEAEGEENLTVRHIKERLGDAHDQLAEISLENERFPNAAEDFRAALKYKTEIYPPDSGIIAEAHYKLSLALEFASVHAVSEEKEEGSSSDQKKAYDENLRAEAAKELEAAIGNTKLRLQAKEVDLATSASPEDNDLTRSEITDLKEMIADMEQRLVELRKSPVDLDAALSAGGNPLSGILGQALGLPSAEAAKVLEEARKGANDLTGLVKKKISSQMSAVTAAVTETVAPAANAGHKRKADDEDDADAEGAGSGSEAKKARVEDA